MPKPSKGPGPGDQIKVTPDEILNKRIAELEYLVQKQSQDANMPQAYNKPRFTLSCYPEEVREEIARFLQTVDCEFQVRSQGIAQRHEEFSRARARMILSQALQARLEKE